MLGSTWGPLILKPSRRLLFLHISGPFCGRLVMRGYLGLAWRPSGEVSSGSRLPPSILRSGIHGLLGLLGELGRFGKLGCCFKGPQSQFRYCWYHGTDFDMSEIMGPVLRNSN